ncbi:MAG: glycosyltransferase family 2 protein [Saprospiraceae bacterium]
MDSNHHPFFSIIMPAYNSGHFIAKTIQSVVNQSFDNWELIIVNDRSTDNTAEIIDTISAKDKRIRLVKTPPNTRKAGLARQVGIQHSQGLFVCFLDSDDSYCKDKLKTHYDILISKQEIDIMSTAWIIVDPKGNQIKVRNRPWFQKLYSQFLSIKNICLLTNPICTSTVVIKKELLDRYDYSLYTTKIAEDWLMWNDLFHTQSLNYFYIETPLTEYRVNPSSLTHRADVNINYYGIVIFSILLSTYKINFFQWLVAVLIRLLRNLITRKSIRV